MKTFIVTILLAMLVTAIGNAHEPFSEPTRVEELPIGWVAQAQSPYETITFEEYQEPILVLEDPTFLWIRDGNYTMEIDMELISNTTMVLKTPIKIEMPTPWVKINDEWHEGENLIEDLVLPKGTKIIVGD